MENMKYIRESSKDKKKTRVRASDLERSECRNKIGTEACMGVEVNFGVDAAVAEVMGGAR